MGRQLRTKLNSIVETREKVGQSQVRQKYYYRGNREATFERGELVMAKDYAMDRCQPVQISDGLGEVTYNVRTNDDRLWKRHVDQLKTRRETDNGDGENEQKTVKPIDLIKEESLSGKQV